MKKKKDKSGGMWCVESGLNVGVRDCGDIYWQGGCALDVAVR